MKLRKFNEQHGGHANHDVEGFIRALETLLHSWSSDTPPEVIWGLNELLNWYEIEYDVQLPRFDEPLEGDMDPDEVIEAIRNA